MNIFFEISYIIQDIRYWAKDVADEIYDHWGWISILGDWFWWLSDWLSDMQWYFIQAGHWLEDVEDWLDKILDWSTIRSKIRQWLPDLEDAVDWFVERYYWFTSEVTKWWNVTWVNVQLWVQNITDWLQEQVNDLVADVSHIVNVVVVWLQIQIDSLLADVTDIYTVITADLRKFTFNPVWYLRRMFRDVVLPWAINQIEWLGKTYIISIDWGDSIIGFFADPIQWIKSHVLEPIVSDFNKGFERGITGEDEE